MKRSASFFLSGLALSSFVLFSACDNEDKKSESTSLTNDEYTEVAVVAGGEISSATEGDFSDISEAANYTGKAGLGKEAVDTTFEKGPLTISLYRKFAPGIARDSSDFFIKGTSTSMVMKRSVKGEWTKTAGMSNNSKSVSINKYHSIKVTGLDTVSAAMTLNGTSSRDNYREMTMKAVETTFHVKGTGSKTDVVINKKSDKYPESGTATYNMVIEKTKSKADKTVVKTITVSVQVTFNGTKTPEIIINKEKKFKLDLETGDVTAM
ncbi:MAG: hypothetical protein J0L62_02790 [Bacteroidetes bacterium]|nr:hypothetical protein [Bacteroidota bacterium]